jgi:hypothetical protein
MLDSLIFPLFMYVMLKLKLSGAARRHYREAPRSGYGVRLERNVKHSARELSFHMVCSFVEQ